MATRKILVGLFMGAVSAACGGAHVGKTAATPPSTAVVVAEPQSRACAVRSIARPIDGPQTGSTVALARLGDREVAFVADEDARSVIAIDTKERKEIARTRLAGAPSQILVTRSGQVLALVRDRGKMVSLEAEDTSGALFSRCSVDTAQEPVGLAVTPDEKTVLVTSGWGRAIGAFDGATLAKTFEVALAREPRAVVVSDDGKTAFVSHAVGSLMSAVDLAARSKKEIAVRGEDAQRVQAIAALRRRVEAARKNPKEKAELPGLEEMLSRSDTMFGKAARHMGCQSFALAKSVSPRGRILAPQVLVNPGDLENRPEGYGDDNATTEEPAIALVDEGAKSVVEDSLLVAQKWRGKDPRDHRAECLLPRAAATDPTSHALLVTCLGIDQLIAYDARSLAPETSERRRWRTGAGANGVAVDVKGRHAYVWSQFDRALDVVSLDTMESSDEKAELLPGPRVALAPLADGEKIPAEYALGRVIFHSAGDGRIARDGRACASCHPDGRDDAITWATPEGPRRSILLAGRVARSAPYSWSGTNPDLPTHVAHTFDRLNGAGLKGMELDALVHYVSRMPGPPEREATDAKRVARGQEIFLSKEAACATCHTPGGTFTDGANHDVKSQHKADRVKAFNTPSLHLVGGAGPYFHDGRYATLRELLQKTDGTMGKTSHLAAADLDALEAYLGTL